MIHGGVKREERRKVQELFRNDPTVRVLLATDAAGEGVDLQNANLMVNYDLPWNPNRLEQRFGRIHRIGQTEVCHLWNMVAAETREGDVFQRLFEKLEIERDAAGACTMTCAPLSVFGFSRIGFMSVCGAGNMPVLARLVRDQFHRRRR